MNKRNILDYGRCISCRSCIAACFYSHNYQDHLEASSVLTNSVLQMNCRHCEQALCEAACPQEAIKRRDDGLVIRSNVKCSGCTSCAQACPFGSIDLVNTRHTYPKCDLCYFRTLEDKDTMCAGTCVSGARTFEDISDIEAQQGKPMRCARTVEKTVRRKR
jgi:anaerobic dimethyl sulfoxide reductase subunit B